MAAIHLALKRFREGRAAVVGLAIVVLVTATCAAAAPRVLDRLADEALRREVGAARPFLRNVQLVQDRRYPASSEDEPTAAIADVGEQLEREMPDGITDLVADRTFVVDSYRWRILNDTADPSFLRLRIQESADDRIRFVEGRPPTDAVRRVVEAGEGPDEDLELVVLEVALSVETMDELGFEVGEMIELQPDPDDRLVARGGLPERAAVDVVGAFEVPDEHDDYWLDDTALIRPFSRWITSDIRYVDVTALVAGSAYGSLLEATSVNHNLFSYTFRYHLDRDRLQAERLGALLVDLRRLESSFPATTGIGVVSGTALRSGLLPLLQRHEARWSAATAALTVVGLGPAAVGLAALALVGSFVIQRRRPALALGRARGGSVAQLLGAVVVEGVLLTLPPTILAVALTLAVLPEGPNAVSIAGAAGVAVLTTLLLAAAGGPSATSPARQPAREERFLRRSSPRRLAFEALIVILAVGGAYLLRERGVRGVSSAAELTGADPFIAAVPALVGLAAGIVAVRSLPVAMVIVSRVAAIRRDLVPVLALRRVTRGGTSGPVLVVLLTTATIGTFSGALLVHLDRGAEAVAWQEVGAPYRISGTGPLPGDLDPLALPGVEAAAGQFEMQTRLSDNFLPIRLVALDAADYASVVAATSGDPALPPELLTETAVEPLPAIVSAELAAGAGGLGPGQTLDIMVRGAPVTFVIVDVRDTFPTMARGGTFAIASRQHIRAVRSDTPLELTTAWYLRAPDTLETAAAIRDEIVRSARGTDVAGRFERTSAIRTAPIVEALVGGVAAAAIVALAYAALAVSAALALAGAARAVEVAHLRTLGLSRREALGLVIVEHGPTIAVAFVAGTALGVGLFALLRDGLGLAALIGTSVEVAVDVDAGQLVAVLAATVIIVAVGIVLGAALQRGAAPSAAIRRGFE